MVHIGSCYGSCLDVLDRQGLGPVGEVVDHCEEVFEALGLWEGTDLIDVDVVETLGRWLELLQGSLGMCLDFRPLAAQACLRPVCHLFVQTVPNKLGRYQPLGDSGSRMGQGMD